jgi:DNA-binding transcriptional MerR regulator
MATYSIKDIEHLSGIKAHTLRIWEKRYNIIEPKRTQTNIRYYDDEDLKKILNISVLNRYGYKISNIANLPEQQLSYEILNLTNRYGDLSAQVENLIVAMVDFDRVYFDNIFNKSIIARGLEETMTKVIYPFFEKIGILWQTGNINPAQEHFISNLIRQKLIVSIDNLPEHQNHNSRNFILFLPDGEWHELGLLFYSYFIKKSGHRVTYLGTSVPLQSVIDMKKFIQVDYVVTYIKVSKSSSEYKKYLYDLANGFGGKSIFLLGTFPQELTFKLPEQCIRPDSLENFKSYLETI